jgi:hypothetical protein
MITRIGIMRALNGLRQAGKKQYPFLENLPYRDLLRLTDSVRFC